MVGADEASKASVSDGNRLGTPVATKLGFAEGVSVAGPVEGATVGTSLDRRSDGRAVSKRSGVGSADGPGVTIAVGDATGANEDSSPSTNSRMGFKPGGNVLDGEGSG